MKICFFAFAICLMVIFSTCSKKKESAGKVRISTRDGVIKIENDPIPQKGIRECILKEELSVGSENDENYMLIKPVFLRLDQKENIFVLDSKRRQVILFDKNGKFIKTVGNKGAGPGEILSPRAMIVDNENKIHILDGKNNKIVRYFVNGSAEIDIRLKNSNPNGLFLDSNGFYYVFNDQSSTSNQRNTRITKYNRKGDVILRSRLLATEVIHSEEQGKFVISMPKPFQPRGYFAFGGKDLIFYGFSDKYEINVLNTMFEKKRTIRVANHKRIKISTQRKERFLDYIKDVFRRRRIEVDLSNVRIPEYDQVFKNIWTDNLGRLLIQIPSNDDKVHIDIFDTDGVYKMQLIFPPPADGIELRWIFSRPVFVDDRIYTIVQNDEGLFFVKKYEIDYKSKRNYD